MDVVDVVASVLVVAAGLQVGLQALGIDVTGHIFGQYEAIVFALMGFSTIWLLIRQWL